MCGSRLWQTSNLRRLRLGDEERRKKEERKKETTGQKYWRTLLFMAALFHRAAIKSNVTLSLNQFQLLVIKPECVILVNGL